MTLQHPEKRARHERRPNRGQIAAARLLVKREKEGKATIPVTQRIRRMADGESQ